MFIFCNNYDLNISNFFETTLTSSSLISNKFGNTKNEKRGGLININQKELLFIKLITISAFFFFSFTFINYNNSYYSSL